MKRIEKRHIIISVVILLVIMIGVTYAYWTAIIEGEGTPMVFETEEYRITFTDSEFLESGRIEPGWSYSKIFTVESKSTVDFKYNIVLEELINTFKTEGSLQYKITSTNGYNMVDYKDIPKSEEASEKVLAYEVNIEPSVIHEYTLELIYHNKEDENQSIDMGSVLSGKIGIKKGTREKKSLYSFLTEGERYPTVETRSDYSTVVGGTEIQSNPTSTGVIYKTTNPIEMEEGEPIYYFAGNPSDNWVKFGKEIKDGVEKDIYWRIIRTNHDKSVRLLYAGTSPDTIEGFIVKSAFNTASSDTMYVGWKYGTVGSLDNNRTNENSSNIRDVLLEWYNTNIKPKYDSLISKEAIYCNDRSGGGYSATENMTYGVYYRLYTNKRPSYQCGMNSNGTLYNDASDSDKFKDGIGLMSADEIAFAGGKYQTNAPNTYYSRNSRENCTIDEKQNCSVIGNNWWWTMSPNVFSGNAMGFYVYGTENYFGFLSVDYIRSLGQVRPVLSLNYNTLVYGTGTANDPYVVEN